MFPRREDRTLGVAYKCDDVFKIIDPFREFSFYKVVLANLSLFILVYEIILSQPGEKRRALEKKQPWSLTIEMKHFYSRRLFIILPKHCYVMSSFSGMDEHANA